MYKNGAVTTKGIFTIPHTTIIHVCNTAGGFGSGFAGCLAKNYPVTKTLYHYRHLADTLELGQITADVIEPGKVVLGLLAMPSYRKHNDGKPPTWCYLSYSHLEECLVRVNDWVTKAGTIPILPERMGCGNAGGDWTKVVGLLDKYLDFYIVAKLGDKRDEP